MNESYLAKDKLIFKTPVVDGRIYIREQKGLYQKVRRSLSWLLMLAFIVIPFITYQGQQAVYFDLANQQFHLFALTLFPQDLMILCLVFILAAFALFYFTKLYGRIWCGFACPQTVWLLMFNWIERRVEGNHNYSKSLDKQPLSFSKVLKKSLKHSLWLVISLFTAITFMAYFVPVKSLYSDFFIGQSSSLVVAWVGFFAVCTYINAGWIKDKMCQHICPYARFQSAMFDDHTKLVTYDEKRGENRGKRKLSAEKFTDLGDCVDCNLCVQVCPVGIDIRNGLQYECISCGLCIDACDMTMEKFNYPKGLISFSSTSKEQAPWQRHLAYGGIITITFLAIWAWLQAWQPFEVSVIRDRQALYQINQQGNVENTYVIKIRNKTNRTNQYTIAVDGLADVKVVGASKANIYPQELATLAITVIAEEAINARKTDIDFTITELTSTTTVSTESSFFSEVW